MSDVIDALKRLERVGSENSKTTQKLLEAAASLERMICEQYKTAGLGDADTVIPVPALHTFYRIEFDRRYIPHVTLHSDKGRVSESRDAAMDFSKHIANGLIDLFADDLAKREEASRSAIQPLQAARITNITIGPAFMWTRDGASDESSTPSDELATAFRVKGMPSGLTAELVPAKGLGAWSFAVSKVEGQKVSKDEGFYDSKEQALAALRAWLQKTQVDH